MRNLALSYIIFLFATIGAHSQSPDLLVPMRTSKKIVTVESASAPFYSIQILALNMPPQDAEYFTNVDNAREFICDDGFVRYVVGQYKTFSEAAQHVDKYKGLGYEGAFVVNTSHLGVKSSTFNHGLFKIDPNKNYIIQVSAFRFPVYLAFFEKISKVVEYYMPDKIYRYCTEETSGANIESELAHIKELGFTDAFIVESEKYKSFQIE